MARQANRSGYGIRPFFRVIKYAKTVRGAEQMIRYVAFRSKDLEGKEKGCFDERLDQANIKAFVHDLPDRLTRHPKAPKAFHCLISLTREDYDRCGLKDWRQVARDVMQTYERESGRKVDWIAAQHDNPTHPHCHIIIKAVYEQRDGVRRQLRLNRDEIGKVREITGRVLEEYRIRQQALERGPYLRPDSRPMLRAYGSALKWLQEQLRQERYRREQMDREHDEWLREQEERER